MVKVLIVDDNDALTMTLAMMLDVLGHQAVTAHSALEGITKAAQEYPSLVLLDINLPDATGYDTCRAMRRMPALRNTVFVAVSGHNDSDHVGKAAAAGFHHYLVKPVSVESLKEVLAAAQAGAEIEGAAATLPASEKTD